MSADADSADSAVYVENDSPVRIAVHDGFVSIVSWNGEMQVLRHFARSATIVNIQDPEFEAGTLVLPVTRRGIEMWQEAVDSMLRGDIWHLHRVGELSVVAQVAEYLDDPKTLEWAIKRLAQAVDSAVRSKYRFLFNQRNLSDAAFWRQMLRPRDFSVLSGTRFASIAETERTVRRAAPESDPQMSDADRHLLSSCQALIDLPQTLQTQVLSQVTLPLCVLVPQLPEDLLPALIRRHLSHESLDVSNQLRILESDTRYTRGMRQLVKHLYVATLAPELDSLRPLRSLSMSGNDLVLADAAPLATFFARCTSELHSLALADNSNPRFTADVLPALTACTALTCLDLSGCQLTQECAAPLGAALRAASGLQRLILNDCIHAVLQDIAAPLAGLSSLTFLSLQNNRLSSGFTALARVLRGLGALQELDLSCNTPPNCDSLACVAAAAVGLPQLRVLKLDNTSLSRPRGSMAVHGLSDPASQVQAWRQLYATEVSAPCSATGTSAAASCSSSRSAGKSLLRGRLAASEGDARGVPAEWRENHQHSESNERALEQQVALLSCSHDASDESALAQYDPSIHSDAAPPAFPTLQLSLQCLHLRGMHGVSIDWLMAIATTQLAWKSNRLRNVGETLTPWKDAVSSPVWEVVQAPATPDVALPSSPWTLVAMLRNLEVLDISNPEYSFRHPHAAGGPNWTCEFILQLPKLRELHTRNLDVKHSSFDLGELSDGLAGKLAQRKVSGLSFLDWSHNSVTFWNLRAVCGIPSLQHLVLQSCGIGVEGATVLANHVSQLTALHTLDLAGNDLKAAGVSALLHGVSKMESLRELTMGRGSGVVQVISELRQAGLVHCHLLLSSTPGQRT